MRYARPAGPDFSPLDEELQLGGGAFSPRLLESIVRLGTWLPFEQVPEGLAFFTQVRIGEETARRLTEAAGAALVAVETAELERIQREYPEPALGPPLQQVSADGAMVPLVHREWAEVKTLAIGTVGSRRTRKGEEVVCTREVSYFSRCVEAEQFRELVLPETYRRGTPRAEVVCAVADGAEWIQHLWDWRCRQAVRILDFPHAVEHLSLAAQAAYGAGTAETSEWLGTWGHELQHGDPDRVLAALRTLAEQAERAEAAEVCTQVLGYLETRRSQIAYAAFQAQGYPIGSGMVESANKLVVEARLKGAGMHWARMNVNPMVALRAMACSDRWPTRWPQLWEALRAERSTRRRCRQQARRPMAPVSAAPMPTPRPRPVKPTPLTPLPRKGTMVDGRPTADHPFKKLPAVRRLPAVINDAKI
jgi:hypothetical protein